MAEYRELQAAIDAIIAMERHDFEEDHFPDAEYAYNDGLIAAMNAVAAVPAADVAEVRHGHWIYRGIYAALDTPMYECSRCYEENRGGYVYWDVRAYEYDYCPNCGALMDESEDGKNV